MTMADEGRPKAVARRAGEHPTFTGNRALMLEEPLLFEAGHRDVSGVDLEPVPPHASRLGGLERSRPIGLPGLSEGEAVRHYTRLSRQNYGIDLGIFPLGSCTMKHNPRLNEKLARLPGFADIHPLAPQDSVQGALALIHMLAEWLKALTKMRAKSCWCRTPRTGPIPPPRPFAAIAWRPSPLTAAAGWISARLRPALARTSRP
jgi:glycine dehydrogenase subunit 2